MSSDLSPAAVSASLESVVGFLRIIKETNEFSIEPQDSQLFKSIINSLSFIRKNGELFQDISQKIVPAEKKFISSLSNGQVLEDDLPLVWASLHEGDVAAALLDCQQSVGADVFGSPPDTGGVVHIDAEWHPGSEKQSKLRVACLQVGYGGVDVVLRVSGGWKQRLPDAIDRVLRNKDIIKVVWGCNDKDHIQEQWGIELENVEDLANSAADAMKCSFSPSLANAVAWFVRRTLPKDKQLSEWEFAENYTEEMIQYARRDLTALRAVRKALENPVGPW